MPCAEASQASSRSSASPAAGVASRLVSVPSSAMPTVPGVEALRVRRGDAVAVRVGPGRTGRVRRRIPRALRVTALVDAAGLVDEEVVADVPPALGDRVVVVD